MRHHTLSIRSLRRARLPVALALAGLLAMPAGAALHTWTGANSTSWSDAGNWLGGLPAPGGELLLDSATRPGSFNDIAGGLTLLGLTLGPNASAPTLSGNALRFQGAGAYLRMLSNAGHGIINNALELDSTLQLTGGPGNGSQLFLRGGISGTGGLSALAGITVLSGNNSYTGATTIAAGAAVGVAGNALAGTSGVQVARGGELQIVRSNVVTALGAPLALGGLLSSSAPELIVNPLIGLQPGGLYSGAITVTDDARILALGGTPSAAVRFVVNGPVDLAGQSLTLATDSGYNHLQTGAISGAGSLTLRPLGGSVSTGALSGMTTLAAAGTGTATVASLGGSGRVLVDFDDSFGRLTLTGALSGQRDLDVRSGTLALGTATPLAFSGQITLSGSGTLEVGRESLLGSASPVLRFENGGRLALRDGLGLTRAITTTGGQARVVMGNGTSSTVSSIIGGDGGISFTGGVITLTGDNSFAGGLGIFNDGSVNAAGLPNTTTLRFTHDGNLGQAGRGITMSGGLALPDGYDLSRPLTLSGTAATLSGSGDHLIASDIGGDGRLNLGGAARWQLTGSTTHTGGVAVAGQANGQAGVLILDSDARLGAAAGVLDLGRLSGITTLPATLVAAGHLDIAATRSTSFRGMTVDTHGFDVVFNQPINGLDMTKDGAGTWTLNTANTNTSGTNPVRVLQGTLALGVDEALGSRSAVTLADGTRLTLGGHALTVTSLDSTAGATVDLGNGGTLRPLFGTLDGSLTGHGSLLVGRAGFVPAAIALNGANSFSGLVEVTQGSRLSVGHVDALGSASLLLDNGTLAAGGGLGAPLVISDATALQIGPGGAGLLSDGQSLVIERTLTGPLTLRIQGGSRPGDGTAFDIRLASRHNGFTGDLVLGDPQGFGSAVLGITADGSLGAASNRLTLGKSFFDGETTRSAQGGLRAWDSFTLPASRSITLDGIAGDTAGFIDTQGHTVVLETVIGELQPGLGLLKTGRGTLIVNAAQAYTGLTAVDEGTLGGHGTLEQLRVQGAELAPGESAGLFSVRQDLSFSSGARLTLELGGSTRGSGYDALDVGGSLDLGGDTELRLSLIDGFLPTASAQFELVHTGGGLFGQFANVADGQRLLTTDGGGSFIVHYGDGQTLLLSDFQAAAVPEPASWALLLAGAAGLAWRRRSAQA